jgi:hypothetical protein
MCDVCADRERPTNFAGNGPSARPRSCPLGDFGTESKLFDLGEFGIERVSDKQYNLTGDLTFLGVTKQLTLRSNLIGQSKDSKGQSRTGSDIYLVIKRSEFGIKGDSPAVGDDIFLTIRVRN